MILKLAGTTRVAIKMLKPFHTALEVQDLLSEYKLLKEVDHPNVIKLLGACTDRHGPIYLIMEFAKYGSLREYLRMKREVQDKLKSHSEFQPSDNADVTQFITEKIIVGYAWQISKGMTYLNEMKVAYL